MIVPLLCGLVELVVQVSKCTSVGADDTTTDEGKNDDGGKEDGVPLV